ncbi:hypothetical protein Q1695_012737 [Nippostrongylus brasiliensis]|nr:hypothetical protein Q1695_012737 [Nippostrongylus brasiliensis]
MTQSILILTLLCFSPSLQFIIKRGDLSPGENEIEIFSVDEGPRFLQWNLERPRPAPLGTLRRLIPRYHERSRRVRRQFFPPYGGGFYPGWGFRRPAGLVGGQQVMIHTPLGPIGYTKVSGFGFG